MVYRQQREVFQSRPVREHGDQGKNKAWHPTEEDHISQEQCRLLAGMYKFVGPRYQPQTIAEAVKLAEMEGNT